MSAKHTPGPWEAVPDPVKIRGRSVWRTLVRAKYMEICTVSGTVAAGLEEANAALIGAAPDLLDALRSIVDKWDGGKDGHGRSLVLNSPEFWAAIKDARAAITKAEGKS